MVSIHAPARGATYLQTTIIRCSKFQSTHPHGVRQALTDYKTASLRVSIHAPARGATTLFPDLLVFFQCFNPRTRTGCDLNGALCALHAKGFNPRTRTGCDVELSLLHPVNASFNPRTRTGCDNGSVGVSI